MFLPDISWELRPTSDCPICKKYAGRYSEKPKRPHPHCKCDIVSVFDFCELTHTHREDNVVNSYLEHVMELPPGTAPGYDCTTSVIVTHQEHRVKVTKHWNCKFKSYQEEYEETYFTQSTPYLECVSLDAAYHF